MSVSGLPVATTSTDDYSSHSFTVSQWDPDNNKYNVIATSLNGFRWAPKGDFALDVTGTSYNKTWDYGFTSSDQTLASYTVDNESSSASTKGVQVAIAIDTDKDNVSSIDIPLPYAASGDNSAMVQSISWTYEGDDTVHTWTSASGEAVPFTSASATCAKMTADAGKYYSSMKVIYSGWSSDLGAGVCTLYGMGGGITTSTDAIQEPNTDSYSENTVTVSAYENGAVTTGYGNATNGF
jgi:uncharacterized membrane protein